MSGRPGSVALGARPVRWLGAGLLAAGLVVPWLVLSWRASTPPPEGTRPPVEVRPEMVALPAGTFMMGSSPEQEDHDDEERLHAVRLTRPFMVSRTEVTQEQFTAVMGEGALYRGEADYGGNCGDAGIGDDLPAVCVTWLEAVTYANRLSELEGLAPAYVIRGEAVQWPDPKAPGYRLPTEAEWEYAARAGTRTVWVGTDRAEDVCRRANVADASAKAQNPGWSVFPCDDGFATLAPVDAKTANPWHLHGLGGNASEWVRDWYGEYEARDGALDDPMGAEGGSDRVVRGGAWSFVPRGARVAVRSGDAPGSRSDGLGFRLSRSCSPSAVSPSDCLPSP